MRSKILFPFFLIAISACTPAPQTTSPSAAQPDSYSAPAPQALTQSGSPADAPSVPPIASASCATKNAAPLNEFRSDPPSKLASNKPRLVEFFAYW